MMFLAAEREKARAKNIPAGRRGDGGCLLPVDDGAIQN